MGKFRKRLWAILSDADTLLSWAGRIALGKVTLSALGGMGGGVLSFIQAIGPTGIFFSILGGVVLGALLSEIITVKKLRKSLRAPQEISKKDSQQGIQYFETRPPLAWYRQKLKETKTVWALWLVGEQAASNDLLTQSSFKKLLLLDPESKTLEVIVENMNRQQVDSDRIKMAITKLTDQANNLNSNSVLWYSGITPSLITIGEPDEDSAWIFLETYIAGLEADQRPSMFFTKKDNPEMFRRLKDSYSQLSKFARAPSKQSTSRKS